MQEALITFGRALFSAGVSAAIIFTRDNFLTTPADQLWKGILIAFLTGVIMFAGDWLRNYTVTPVPTPQAVRAESLKTRTYSVVSRPRFAWAHYLPF